MLLVPTCAVDPCAYCLTTYKRNIVNEKLALPSDIRSLCDFLQKFPSDVFSHKNCNINSDYQFFQVK